MLANEVPSPGPIFGASLWSISNSFGGEFLPGPSSFFFLECCFFVVTSKRSTHGSVCRRRLSFRFMNLYCVQLLFIVLEAIASFNFAKLIIRFSYPYANVFNKLNDNRFNKHKTNTPNWQNPWKGHRPSSEGQQLVCCY